MGVTGTIKGRSILKQLKRSQTLDGHPGMHFIADSLKIVAQRPEAQRMVYLIRNFWAILKNPEDVGADGPFSSDMFFSDGYMSILRCVSLQ
jgi:hypothetical protein